MSPLFANRRDAGRRLAAQLMEYAHRKDVVVLALPRGGVPVAYEVALALDAPLDVFLVRKLGVPGHEELAMGAIASGGVRVINQSVVDQLRIFPEDLDRAAEREGRELERRLREYRGIRPPVLVEGRVMILIDDGLATGSTMRAAAAALRPQNPSKIVVAVPTAAGETCEEFRHEVDDVVCVTMPQPFHSVGAWYEDFTQTSDEEVRELLTAAVNRPAPESL